MFNKNLCMFTVILFLVPFQLLFCDKGKHSNEDVPSILKPTFHHKYHKSQIFVYDNVIPEAIRSVVLNYLKRSGFSYMYPDPYENYYEPSEGDLFWKCLLSPSLIIKSRLWISIRKLYKNLPEEITGGNKFLPYDVYGTYLQRGDVPVAFTGESDDKTDGKIFVRIFLSSKVDKNVYHDQAFYDENDEIITSIHPRPFRIIAWTGNLQTLFRPPSVNSLDEEYSIVLKLTSNKTLFKEGVNRYKELEERAARHKLQQYPYKNMVHAFDINGLNVSQHVLGKYYDKHGNVMAFFDNVFPKEFVNAIRSYYVRRENALTSDEYGSDKSEIHDNVEYIYHFKSEDVLNTPYIEVVKKLTEYLSNHTGWHPYDVSCNLIRHTHHTRIHIDCINEEYEFTFLMYLNPNWTEDMYAETSFYDKVENKKDDPDWIIDNGMEEYNFITAVIPKFGRIALFRNLIPHSARPPAPSFLAARYTFPIKVSDSYRQARAKKLRESLDYIPEEERVDPLYESLEMGNYEPFLKDEKREWVEQNYKLIMEKVEKSIQKHTESVKNFLFPNSKK